MGFVYKNNATTTTVIKNADDSTVKSKTSSNKRKRSWDNVSSITLNTQRLQHPRNSNSSSSSSFVDHHHKISKRDVQFLKSIGLQPTQS